MKKNRENAINDFIADVTVTHTWTLLTREERAAFIKIIFGMQNDLCGTYRQRYETCKHVLRAFLVGAQV